MKKNILEQTNTKVVNAPRNELDLLQQDIFLNKGRLVNIELDPNGNPKPIKVGGKIYTAAIQTEKGNYIVYDGRVLKKTADGYDYILTNDGKIGMVRGSVDRNLTDTYNKLLRSFGINEPENLYSILDQTFNRMQELIDKGAISNVFRRFNNILRYYYPNDELMRLRPMDGKESYDELIDKNQLASEYNREDLRDLRLVGYYYLPKGQSDKLFGKQLTRNENCVSTLGNYLIFALQSKATGEILLNDKQRREYKKEIKRCKGLGAYDKRRFKGFTKDNLDLQIQQKLNPFGFLNKKLNYKEVEDQLQNINQRWRLLENNSDKLSLMINRVLKEEKENKDRMNAKKTILESKLINITDDIKRFNSLKEEDQVRISFKVFKELSNISEYNLVNEQLGDILKGIFGNLFPGALETMGEKMVNSILSWFGLGGYFKDFLVSAITTHPTKLVEAMKSCESLVSLVADSLSEAMVMKIQKDRGVGGTGYDMIRNVLGDTLKSSEFVDNLKNQMSSTVCSLYDKYIGKSEELLNRVQGG